MKRQKIWHEDKACRLEVFHMLLGKSRGQLLIAPERMKWLDQSGNDAQLWISPHSQQKSLKCYTWVQSQKRQNGLFLRQIIQHHNNPSLCPNHWCQWSWSWPVQWRPTSRTNSKKRCPFHHRGLECKNRKSRDTWSNRQVWPGSTKWGRAKVNRVSRERTGHSKHLFQQPKRWLYMWTSPDSRYWNQIDYVLCSQR